MTKEIFRAMPKEEKLMFVKNKIGLGYIPRWGQLLYEGFYIFYRIEMGRMEHGEIIVEYSNTKGNYAALLKMHDRHELLNEFREFIGVPVAKKKKKAG